MIKYYYFLFFAIILNSCATYKTKYGEAVKPQVYAKDKTIAHTVYLIGDAGLSPLNDLNPALKIFKKVLNNADSNSTAIFLGDNIYPAGLPKKKDSSRAYKTAKSHLDAQLNTLENFKGLPLFIPGNHDWYNDGLKGLERQEKYVKKKLQQKNPFLPENGCPIETLKVSDELAIIVIDSEWYLTNWDKHPTMNDNCQIKSRAKFWEEVESAIKKNRDKTTLIAMHHPMFSYGPHGGQFSFKQQLFQGSSKVPLPIIGSVINILRKTSGASPEDIINKRYSEFKNRMVTLAQYSEKVIFASGHEHALQYIREHNTPQIVSGAGAKKGVTRLLNGSQFSTGNRGYAALTIYKDGSSQVEFHGIDEGQDQVLFRTEVLSAEIKNHETTYDDNFASEATASIYTQDEIDKSEFFKTIWGDRYRKYYGTKVTAPTVNLDTLFGGLKPVRKGGGHQSKSLRLRHKSGKEYVMRALKKVSELYLQSMVFQERYIMKDLEDSFVQELLQDFYTGSHPYAPFTIGDLSDAIGIYHTNPKLYYIPRQSSLGHFNSEFGNELYMIEEHAGDDHGDLASFGFSDKLISTNEMLENLRDDEKYEVDSKLYARARLFDMILGDWDRHVDQWRWAQFKNKSSKKIIYRPVPRDRDQAYSIMGDGLFMSLATRLVSGLRIMEGFKEEIRSVEGFNSSPKTYVLDVAVLSETTKEQWLNEAEYIQKNLTTAIIEQAFENFPFEVKDATIDELKKILFARIQNIKNTAIAYYQVLNRHAMVVGTDKDDWFEIENLSKEKTVVRAFRNIEGKKEKKFFEKTFSHEDTKEIWIYGLDDEDRFEVKGNFKNKIKLRLIGGQNNDIYSADGSNNFIVYDYRSKKNRFKNIPNSKLRLTDEYKVNTYQPSEIKKSINQILPLLAFNPDTGLEIGLSNTYTYNGFRQNPFTQEHRISGGIFTATGGFELNYTGEFANAFGSANFEIDARFTSPNFAINFFGFGNETENLDEVFDLNYNRVRIGSIKLAPSLVWRGSLGSKIKLGLSYEAITIENTQDRFISSFLQSNGDADKNFLGAEASYIFENSDNAAFPTLGLATMLQIGYKSEIGGEGNFGYIIPSLSLDYKLISSGKLVLAAKWKAHVNFGNEIVFYQAASIGGVDGLRGFRNERFTGKSSFYQNTDLRLSLGKVRTGILPAAFGIYGGYDYGRVFNPDEVSQLWHTSYGGGFFLDAAGVASLRAALFNSVEGPRFSFGLGFGF